MAQHLDSRCVLLSAPGTSGAGGPNQNTSRMQHTGVSPPILFMILPFRAPGRRAVARVSEMDGGKFCGRRCLR